MPPEIAKQAIANHFLYLCNAIQLTAVEPANIKVPALVLYAPTDQIFAESSVQETIQKIGATGGSVESATLVGPNGHLNAITENRPGGEQNHSVPWQVRQRRKGAQSSRNCAAIASNQKPLLFFPPHPNRIQTFTLT